MIPIVLQNEPNTFNEQVRLPGQAFLLKTPNPTDEQWKGKEYWQKILPSMRIAYNKICAYCSCWIPHSTGSHSVDHFMAKSASPNLAYEWSNYRYVSTRFNSRKGVQAIIDPFVMQFNWFIIDFTCFFIKPNIAALTNDQIQLANETIRVLKFNEDEDLVNERMSYFVEYVNKHIDYDYLNRKAPFIASEIRRQNLL